MCGPVVLAVWEDPDWLAIAEYWYAIFALPALRWGYMRFSFGRRGERELTRIYRGAIPDQSSPCGQRVAVLLNQPQFVRDVLVPQSVSRSEEIACFREKLQGVAENLEIESFLDGFYKKILDGLDHDASYPAWQRKAEDWKKELRAATSAQTHTPGLKPKYMVLGLLRFSKALEHRAALAEKHFEFPRHGDDSLLVSGEDIQLDADQWRLLVEQALAQVRTAELNREQLHIVLGTVTLWNLAFGWVLNNKHQQHVLYHVEDGIHRIWEISRDVKNRRSPGGAICEDLLQVTAEGFETGTPDQAEAIVLSIGSNHIVNDVRSYLGARGANWPLRVVTKKAPELSPERPDDWVQYAVEMSDLISQSAAPDLYIFADMPAVLALMVGDSLGPYRGRMHLMQFTHDSEPGKQYQEVLCLPDAELDRLID